jgi:hypothetical protein
MLYNTLALAANPDIDAQEEPSTLKQAKESFWWNNWKAAMAEEFNSLI